jgi:hypothetical protein
MHRLAVLQQAKAKRPQRKFSLRKAYPLEPFARTGRRDPPVLALRRVFFRTISGERFARDEST